MKLASYVRPAAAVVGLAAWAGLALQFHASFGRAGSIGTTLWILLRYFTVLSNLWLAVQMTGAACGVKACAAPRPVAAVTVAMLLVGVVYGLLLNGMLSLSGGALTADVLLHKVTPLLITLFWLGFTPKGRLRFADAPRWLIVPAVYLVYALGRGLAGDLYAYPFLDLGKLGVAKTAVNLAVMGVAYLLGGYAFVALDGVLGRKRR